MSLVINRIEVGRVPAYGNKYAYVAIVGQSPGKDEAIEGRPFVGRAGKIIREWLRLCNIYPNNCFWTNITDRVLLGSEAPTKEDIEEGKERLKKELFSLPNLRYTVLVGTFAARTVFYGSMTDIVGQKGNIYGVFPCTAIWHPAYYLRSASKERQATIKSDVVNVLTEFIKPSIFDVVMSKGERQ